MSPAMSPEISLEVSFEDFLTMSPEMSPGEYLQSSRLVAQPNRRKGGAKSQRKITTNDHGSNPVRNGMERHGTVW